MMAVKNSEPEVGTTPETYVSYLLRIWQGNNGQEPIWRASLQSSLTGERQVFASLDHLFAFLRRRVGSACSDGQGEVAADS